MVGAGLLARNAVARGPDASRRRSRRPSRPGSKAVTGYLETAGLMAPLAELGLRAGRLRLHDLHRQLRPARRADRRGDRGATTSSSRRCCPATATSRAGSIPLARAELPRLAAARRRVRARGPGRHRPHDRAARHRPRRHGRSCSPTSGRRPTRSSAVIRDSIDPELFQRTYATRLRRRRPLAGAADPGRRPLRLGSGARRTSRSRRSSTGLTAEPAAVTDIDGARVAGGPRRLGHDRPHLPGRLDRALVAGRPVAPGARRRRRSSSTRTAPAAATTR